MRPTYNTFNDQCSVGYNEILLQKIQWVPHTTSLLITSNRQGPA